MQSSESAYCAEQVRRYDRERYVTALFADARRRDALLALYAFNLELARTPDSVSEPMLGEIRLQWWREAVAEIFEARPRRHEVVAALAGAVTARPDLRSELEALIDARTADLYETRYADLDELESYLDTTSGRVVRLALAVLGINPEDSVNATARQVGIGFGLAGVIRALPFHIRQRRIYLPEDLLAQQGLSRDDVLAGRGAERLSPIVAELARIGQQHLKDARAVRGRVPAGATAALLPATLADRHLAQFAEHGRPADTPGTNLVPPWQILRLAAKAWRGRY